MPESILIISNYFPPEKGAAANRIFSLANGLKEYDYDVTVVCPLPNYPDGKVFNDYKGKLKSKKNEKGIHIIRLWLFASNSRNKFIRLFSMLSFSFSLFFYLLFKKTPKKVIIQCSPLFVGLFGVLIAKLKGKTIILNVSDLWPLAGLKMGILSEGTYYRILEKIELFNYKNANFIMGQSQEILDHIHLKFPKKKGFLYRNFPDFPIQNEIEVVKKDTIKIVYAGLLGVAQGIYNICKELQLPENIELHIFGNGPESQLVKDRTDQHDQIYYHGMIDRSELHKKLMSFDIVLIPLINRIYGSVPSKIFEYSRLGLPILYFSDGEGNDLVVKHQLGWAISDNDFNALNAFLIELSEGTVELPTRVHILNVADTAFDFSNQFKELLLELEQL